VSLCLGFWWRHALPLVDRSRLRRDQAEGTPGPVESGKVLSLEAVGGGVWK